MADVTDRRGQLIILMGLLLAIAFVVLALLLNTVIFTENLASRGVDLGGRDAVEYHRTLVTGIGELVDEENEHEHGGQSAVDDSVTAGIATLDDILTVRYAETAIVGDIDETAITTHDGKLVRQTDSGRHFNASTDVGDWTMVSNATDVRQFSMTVDRVDLAVANESNASSVAFHVFTDADGGSWRTFVYENATSGNISIAVRLDGGSVTQVCSVDRATATVDLTAGTLAGQPCDGLDWAEGIDDRYDLEFVNGQQATGTYDLTVNTSAALTEVDTQTVNDGGPSPYYVPAVYSVTVDLHYENADLVYGAEVRIARGEPT